LNLLVLILLLFFPLEFNPTQPRTFLALWLLKKWQTRGVQTNLDSTSSEELHLKQVQLKPVQSNEAALTEPLMEQ
jgi:hypothetical protein